MYIDIQEEARELRGHFPGLDTSDFYRLDNDNIGVLVTYSTESVLEADYDVLIEFPRSYPDKPPNGWIQSPDIDNAAPHTLTHENGDTKICFTNNARWKSRLTSYDAAAMIKTWIFAYSNWKDTGNWEWDEGY